MTAILTLLSLWMALPARAALAARATGVLAPEAAVRAAREAFLAGRYEDAASSWRYLSEIGVAAPEPEANLALTLRDKGEHEAATAQWLKTSLLEGADGFAWNQRAWSYLSTGRRPDAREAFAKALDRSSTTAMQAEANLGLGLASILDGKPRAAAEPLRRAGVAGAYAISISAQLIAESALAAGDRQRTLAYLRQAVEIDPANSEALRALARQLERTGDNRAAWRAYRRLLSLDPKDAAARKSYERVARYVTGDQDSAAGVRRIARPVLNSEAADFELPLSTRAIRVGLYGAADGRPATLTRAYVMLNSAFKVTSLSHGVLRDNGRAFDQWEIDFRSENGLVEVRDASRNILFTAKQPFAFVPDAKHGSTLVKSALVADRQGAGADSIGVEVGDREVRGAVEVVPNPWGLRLVQVAPLEQYLMGVVSLALPEDAPPQAARAAAVVARTAAYWSVENRSPTLERCDLLDDDSVQRTIGVSGEMRSAVEAVRETEGLALALNGRPARVLWHIDSGGTTEDGGETGEPGLSHLVSVQDAAVPRAPWRTAAELERFTHEAPPEGLYSEAAPAATPASARWMRVLDARELRTHIERHKDLGALRHLRVAGRTSTGRVRAIEVLGANGRALYSGRKEIEELLSPGSLRSTLFTLQPILDGRRVTRVILWGAGTGHGLGFSRAGAMGQASLGIAWREILRHYFPRLEVKNFVKPAAAAVKIPAAGSYKRRLDFHKRKK